MAIIFLSFLSSNSRSIPAKPSPPKPQVETSAEIRESSRAFAVPPRTRHVLCNSFGCFSRVPRFLVPHGVPFRRRCWSAAETGTRASFARSHGQEKHRRYLGGDRGVRADTYRRRHFSWPRVIPSFRIPANFWIFQPRDQTGERSGDCACSRIGSICKNLWERIFVKREIFPFLFTDGLKFAYSWQCLKMLFSEKIINSFINDE